MCSARGTAPAPGPVHRQAAIVHRLLERARAEGAADAALIETHISFVLVAGGFAYKVKKAVNLGFVDFSTVERRRFFCDEELRLNRRLAAGLYLDVVAVTGGEHDPRLGGAGEALDWAVRMRAFAQRDQWDRMVRDGRLDAAHVDRLARVVADFHRGLEPSRGAWGSAGAVLARAAENFAALDRLVTAPREREALAALAELHEREAPRVAELVERRRREGFVRECHGDLHLANIAQVGGDTVVFDCLEFDEAFRWTDVAAEIAFPVMDLRHRGRGDLSARLLDGWLEITGDYGALDVLPFYLRYRALVRAKVSAIRASQEAREHERAPARADRVECRDDLRLALWYARRPTPVVVAMHGVSGAGKTVASQRLLELSGAVRVRSDLERKRSHGLAPDDHGGAPGLYSDQASADTYALLAAIARRSVAAGFTVIVDATFLRRAQREAFRGIARERGVRFVIVDVRAGEATLRARVAARAARGADASDADVAVLERQLAAREPVDDGEADRVWRWDGERPPGDDELARRWRDATAR